MTLVNMDGSGLHILPTHRVVHGLASFDVEDFTARAEAVFSSVKRIAAEPGDAEALLGVLASRTAAAGPEATVLLAVTRERVLLLTMDRAARDRGLGEIAERTRRLDMVVLHEAVLSGLLGISADAVKAGEYVRYQRDALEAITPVLRGEAQVSFLVNPVTMAQLRENTFAGEVMPQKSTDFYPKLLSGLAIYAMDEESAPGGPR